MTERGTSSPAAGGFKSLEEEIAYYKSQYGQLEVELQEFQASSKELEAELEKDVEASEKRERSLREKLEGFRYEVEEWKTKYKQSKTEANSAQSNLQKEITSLRDTNRTLQLRLRDIEVANDDYERQARNTTSSLEDLESKYNVALERGVMLEEEIRNGEQEREALRIEAQRLRDELSDLKVEAEITQEKLRAAETGHNMRPNRISTLSDSRSRDLRSPTSDRSFPISTPTTSTPPAPKSEGSTAASENTPPSPPLSDPATAATAAERKQPIPKRSSIAPASNMTPRPSTYARPRHTRGPSLAPTNGATPSFRKPPQKTVNSQEPLPRSGSLYQIRGLIGKMQKLEERVHSVKSKLPAPTTTPPRASPRGTMSAASNIPATVTVRSNKKHASSSTSGYQTPSRDESSSRLGHRQSRMSFGGPSVGESTPSRPSSRASNASNPPNQGFARPGSRASLIGGRATAGTHHAGSAAESRRPRSSMGGSLAQSVGPHSAASGRQTDESGSEFATPTARRTTLDRNGLGSAIPTPHAKGLSSSVVGRGPPRRESIRGASSGTPRPASQQESRQPNGDELGETF